LSESENSATAAGAKTPPCKRCGNADWSVESREKGRLRWLLETVFAAPDVWIFQSESGGWPGKSYELWTCRDCGRQARVS
jgi:hypothetical protein